MTGFSAKLGNMLRFDVTWLLNDFGLLLELPVSIKGFIPRCSGNSCFVVASLFSLGGGWDLSGAAFFAHCAF